MEVRRLMLVFCATLIRLPVARITCMISVVAFALTVHWKFHPYSDRAANTCANVSLFATLMVGILNFGWATFVYSGSNFDFGDAEEIGQVLITLENALIQLFPIGAVVFCAGYLFYVNFVNRCT